MGMRKKLLECIKKKCDFWNALEQAAQEGVKSLSLEMFRKSVDMPLRDMV